MHPVPAPQIQVGESRIFRRLPAQARARVDDRALAKLRNEPKTRVGERLPRRDESEAWDVYLEIADLDEDRPPRVVPAAGLFVLIGSVPHTAYLEGVVQRDDSGYLLVGREVDRGALAADARAPLPLETSLPGVFAIGDARRGSVKRVATAVGDGAAVVQLVHICLTDTPEG